jgi:hypothetical protein
MKYFLLVPFDSQVMYSYDRIAGEKRIRRRKGAEQSLCCKSLFPIDDILFLPSRNNVMEKRVCRCFVEREQREAVLTMIERNTKTMLLQSINAKAEHFPNEAFDAIRQFNLS